MRGDGVERLSANTLEEAHRGVFIATNFLYIERQPSATPRACAHTVPSPAEAGGPTVRRERAGLSSQGCLGPALREGDQSRKPPKPAEGPVFAP